MVSSAVVKDTVAPSDSMHLPPRATGVSSFPSRGQSIPTNVDGKCFAEGLEKVRCFQAALLRLFLCLFRSALHHPARTCMHLRTIVPSALRTPSHFSSLHAPHPHLPSPGTWRV
jgi:hypothetical protein